MTPPLSTYQLITKHLKRVVFQNAVTLVNGIFLVVTLLLIGFKEVHEALFLSLVLVLNVVIGIIQDLRAKVALEQLQILTAPKIIRVSPHGTEETISLDEVAVGDRLQINLGDQIPADGELVESNGLEINEALLTGESDSKSKPIKEKVLAGSIVTSGSGILQVGLIPKNSFVAHMTEKIKQFTVKLSPIQKTLSTFIKYMSYLLLAIVVYVVIHGLTVHQLLTSIVKDIAALTSTLVPQGLILATTVFFAYGAIRMFKQNVLLQEINATEKLGRIKNLCVDKTGTLTENTPIMEATIPYPGKRLQQNMEQLIAGYLQANNDHSETGKALQGTNKLLFSGSVLGSFPFSSNRKYGMARIQISEQKATIVLGAPDILLPYLTENSEQQWLQQLIESHSTQAKRLLLLASTDQELMQPLPPQSVLHPEALFVLSNPLRPGTAEIIHFFQNRGVSIRVISGDNPHTVQAIAQQAGVKYTDLIATGPEMEKWDEEAYTERVPAYHLFARISPVQKEKIITILKNSGFTAMVGDGANDAMAIKKADLGIAMFDGAGVTRQIAEVVLMNNSFAALPTGVEMAETIITNIELVASVFFNSITIGLVLFFILAILSYTYPLAPRNTTIINYCILWLPLAFWSFFPAHKKSLTIERSFLRRILPFSLLNGVITGIAAVTVFLLGPTNLKYSESNILVILVIATLGYWFFLLAPLAYGIVVEKKQQTITKLLAGVIVVFLTFAILQPSLSTFFGLHRPGLVGLAIASTIIFIFGWLQYQITTRWFSAPLPNK
jgi:cation-transporting ATPase E